MVLNLVNKRSDVDTNRTCLLTWTVSALHATRSFGHGLFFGIDTVVEISGPVVFQLVGCSFVSDFILVSVFLSVLSADNLGFVELGSSW